MAIGTDEVEDRVGAAPRRGRFVVLEGGEGSGKSTQVALLGRWLESLRVPHLVAREPGGTALGEAVRAILLGSDLAMSPESELFLFLASRAAFVREVVRPALEAGKVVVADRFALSTLAYQGWGRGLDLDLVRAAGRVAAAGLEPDLTVVLDVPVEEGVARRGRAGRAEDRIEREGAAFLDRVRHGYLALAGSEPLVRVIDGTAPAGEVHAAVRDLLRAEIPETFGGAEG